MNVTVQLEFELIYFEAAVQYFSHYAMWTPFKMGKDDRMNENKKRMNEYRDEKGKTEREKERN